MGSKGPLSPVALRGGLSDRKGPLDRTRRPGGCGMCGDEARLSPASDSRPGRNRTMYSMRDRGGDRCLRHLRGSSQLPPPSLDPQLRVAPPKGPSWVPETLRPPPSLLLPRAESGASCMSARPACRTCLPPPRSRRSPEPRTVSSPQRAPPEGRLCPADDRKTRRGSLRKTLVECEEGANGPGCSERACLLSPKDVFTCPLRPWQRKQRSVLRAPTERAVQARAEPSRHHEPQAPLEPALSVGTCS